MIWKRGLILVLFLVLLTSSVSAGAISHLTLNDPALIYVEKDDMIKFDFKGEEYQILITDFYTYSVEFQISGKLSDFLLHEDEYLDVNLDDFGETDLKITAQTIIPKRKATLLIEKINARVPVIDSPMFKPVERPVIEETVEENETEGTVPSEEVEESEEGLAILPIEEKPGFDLSKYSSVLYLLIALIAMAVILYGAFYIKVSSYAAAGVPPKLTKFAKDAIDADMPILEVRASMKDAGWDDEEVDLAIKHVQGLLPV